jgi:hypothetical protein
MTVIPPPATVTRFYGNVDFALDVLKRRQIAFVHVSILNDPYDPYCFFETDFGASYPNLIRYVQENHPKDLGWFRARVTALSWRNTVRELKVYLQKLREFSFVLSDQHDEWKRGAERQSLYVGALRTGAPRHCHRV